VKDKTGKKLKIGDYVESSDTTWRYGKIFMCSDWSDLVGVELEPHRASMTYVMGNTLKKVSERETIFLKLQGVL
jgi:hypothetical protein